MRKGKTVIDCKENEIEKAFMLFLEAHKTFNSRWHNFIWSSYLTSSLGSVYRGYFWLILHWLALSNIDKKLKLVLQDCFFFWAVHEPSSLSQLAEHKMID